MMRLRSMGLAAALAMAAGTACSTKEHRLGGPQRGPFSHGAEIPTNIKDEEAPKVYCETHLAAAQLFESHKQFNKAVVQYRKAIAVNHNYVEAYHRLGLLLSMLGRREEAIEALAKTVKLSPDDALARNNLGFELLLAGRYPEAADQLEKSLALQPGFSRAHINLALLHSKVGQFDQALSHFQAALPAAEAHYNLGLMYRSHKRFDDAAASFARALQINSKFAAAKTQLQQLDSLRTVAAPEEALAASQPTTPPPAPRPAPPMPVPGKPAIETARQASEDAENEAMARLDAVFDAPIDLYAPAARRDPPAWDEHEESVAVAENEARCRGSDVPAPNEVHHLVENPDDGTIESWSTPWPVTDPVRTACTTQPVSFPDEYDSLAEERAGEDAEYGYSLADGQPRAVYESWPATVAVRHSERGPVMFATVLASDPEPGFSPLGWTVEEISSVDSWALLRELESEISAVRNEIGCLDEAGRVPVIDVGGELNNGAWMSVQDPEGIPAVDPFPGPPSVVRGSD